MTDSRDVENARLRRIIDNLNDLNGRQGFRVWWNAWLLLMAGCLIGAWIAWWLQ